MSKQLFTIDVTNRILEIYEDDILIKKIDNVWIGKNGYALESDMVEGNEKTPLGLYNLGVAFGMHDLNISYPYFKIEDNDYWVDDSNSKHYNYMVRIGKEIENFGYPYIISLNEKDFTSAEHLITFKKQYEYAVFIEYNCFNQIENGIGNNKSSAIFLHCHGDKGYTGGCVAVSREDMKYILNILDKNKNPQILIKK